MIGREVKLGRTRHGLSQDVLGKAAGFSGSKVGRVERGQAPRLTIEDALLLLACVGLDLFLKTFPAGEPVRDVRHSALLARLARLLHATLGWALEVPLPITGDRRAWDAMISGPGWRVGVEAEMHPNDRQALERKIALKQRDGGVQSVILLLARTEANRQFLRANEPELLARFPMSGRDVMADLRAGRQPRGSAIVFL